MFRLEVSYTEDKYEMNKTKASKTIALVKETDKGHNIFLIKGSEPEEDAGRWGMKRGKRS